MHPDAQAQPLLANGILYLREATGGVSAFKASDGTRLWHQNLGHAVVVHTVANGVIYGTVVASLDPRQSSIFALDESSGKVLWESPQAGGTLERVADGVVYVGFCPLGWLLLRGAARWTGLEVLRHLIFGQLTFAKGAGSFGQGSLRMVRFHLSPLPTVLQLPETIHSLRAAEPRTV